MHVTVGMRWLCSRLSLLRAATDTHTRALFVIFIAFDGFNGLVRFTASLFQDASPIFQHLFRVPICLSCQSQRCICAALLWRLEMGEHHSTHLLGAHKIHRFIIFELSEETWRQPPASTSVRPNEITCDQNGIRNGRSASAIICIKWDRKIEWQKTVRETAQVAAASLARKWIKWKMKCNCDSLLRRHKRIQNDNNERNVEMKAYFPESYVSHRRTWEPRTAMNDILFIQMMELNVEGKQKRKKNCEITLYLS